MMMIGELSLRKTKHLHGNLGGVKMNPVFWLLVIIIAIALWFLLAFIFHPIGEFMWKIGSDTVEELNKEDKEENKE